MFVLFGVLSVEATHLIGGYMSYQYIGKASNGNSRYKVTLNVYRDCYQSEVPLDKEINFSENHPAFWRDGFFMSYNYI